ncbi:uncharacterized protein LOC115961675 [Quercus lobata]|uniref:uncharacterized protein LOC115961675 n=1 Tax=Quercus lobata TaxID=97700 RepID=UPI001243B3D5|nr:uncharacterized protein LOC115961675 [Quercus lobata]
MPYLKCVDEEEAKYIWKKSTKEFAATMPALGGRSGARQEVRQVPTIQECPTASSRETDDDSLPVAIRMMGNRHRRSITPRFGIPLTIISDNRRQFDNEGFRDFCSNLAIKNQFSSLGHPQANGQIEVTNRTLLKIIKAKLDDGKGAWPEELPNVL